MEEKAVQENKDNPFTSLSTEILVQILSHLDPFNIYSSIAKVCKRLHEVCKIDGGMWSEITLKLGVMVEEEKMSYDHARRWIRICPALKRITLSGFLSRGEDPVGIEDLAVLAIRECRSLESLTISLGCFGPRIFRVIGESGQSLRHIRLDSSQTLDLWTREDVRTSVECLRNLTCLELSQSFGEEWTRAIADLCQEVTSLHFFFNGCFHVQSSTSEDVTYFLQKRHRTIKSLRFAPRKLEEKTLKWIGRCDKLEVLEGVYLEVVSLPGLQELSKLTSLKRLGFCFRQVQNGSLTQLFNSGGLRGLTSLRFEFIRGLRDEDLEAVAIHCPMLTDLKIFWCDNLVVGNSLKNILQLCTRLTSWSIVGDGEDSVTPDVFKDAVAPLRVLSIGWPDKSTEEGQRMSSDLRKIASLMPNLTIRDYHHANVWIGRPL